MQPTPLTSGYIYGPEICTLHQWEYSLPDVGVHVCKDFSIVPLSIAKNENGRQLLFSFVENYVDPDISIYRYEGFPIERLY